MKTKMITIIATILLIGLAFVGVTYAQTASPVPSELHYDLDEPYSGEDIDIQAVCLGEIIHPALDRLAEEYEVAYNELLVYFCDYEFGVGEIEHALATAALEDVEYTYEELLEWRYNEGMKDVGWGEIWQELGLIGLGMPGSENDDDGLNPMCAGILIHPVLDRLAEEFNVAYSDLLIFFCEGQFGIGEIKLALETAQQEDIDLPYDEILGMRSKGDEQVQGWGQIWQELGLIGRGRVDNEGTTELDENMPPTLNENNGSTGRPVVPPGQSGEHPGKGRGLKK